MEPVAIIPPHSKPATSQPFPSRSLAPSISLWPLAVVWVGTTWIVSCTYDLNSIQQISFHVAIGTFQLVLLWCDAHFLDRHLISNSLWCPAYGLTALIDGRASWRSSVGEDKEKTGQFVPNTKLVTWSTWQAPVLCILQEWRHFPHLSHCHVREEFRILYPIHFPYQPPISSKSEVADDQWPPFPGCLDIVEQTSFSTSFTLEQGHSPDGGAM